jgi:Tfp pilus assembly protein PilV
MSNQQAFSMIEVLITFVTFLFCLDILYQNNQLMLQQALKLLSSIQ